SIEPAGLGRWHMLEAADAAATAMGQRRDEPPKELNERAAAALREVEDEHAAALAARAHAFDLVRGDGHDNPYVAWLAPTTRAPLLARSIKRWTDYAPDLRKIFRSELLNAMEQRENGGGAGQTQRANDAPPPDPGDLAAFRFIESTAPAITGETPSFHAIRTE